MEEKTGNKKGFDLNLISRYRDEMFGIAIIMIVLFHYLGDYFEYYSNVDPHMVSVVFARRYIKYIRSLGVEIFVFLSGMGMYYSFSRDRDIRSFYGRRYRRLLIPYAIVGGAFWIIKDVLLCSNGWLRFLQDFLFVTFFTDKVHTLWFILLMAFIYLLTPFLFKAIYGYGKETACAAVLIIMTAAIPVILKYNDPVMYGRTEIALSRIPLFIAGLYAGRRIKEGRRIPHTAAILTVMIVTALHYYVMKGEFESYIGRYSASLFSIAAIICMAYLFEAISKAELLRRALRFFGRYSLEIYLLHVTIRNILGVVEYPRYKPTVFIAMMAVTLILSPLLSKLTDRISGLMTQAKEI